MIYSTYTINTLQITHLEALVYHSEQYHPVDEIRFQYLAFVVVRRCCLAILFMKQRKETKETSKNERCVGGEI